MKLKQLFVSLAFAFALALPFATSSVSLANTVSDQLKKGACDVGGGDCTTAPDTQQCDANGQNCVTVSAAETKVQDIVTMVVDIFSWIVGVVAVIMIIFAGFKYITSGGDSGKVSSAKNTIIYAIVGLIIVALAQTIVFFVIDKAA